jgi:hypothetical protein
MHFLAFLCVLLFFAAAPRRNFWLARGPTTTVRGQNLSRELDQVRGTQP